VNLKEIVLDYLMRNGFDGLFLPVDCACEKADLFPCGDPREDCEAGYRTPCNCGDHDWHISRTKDAKDETECGGREA
jgi:hypothetical protein